MNLEVPNRGLAFMSVTLLAAVVLPSVVQTGASPNDRAAPQMVLTAGASGGPPVSQALRRLHVHRVWCKPGMTSDPRTGMALCAHVEAVGLRWRSLLVEVRLRTADGKPVRVVAPAPEGYADEKGFFYMCVQVPVLADGFEWPELCASFPHETLLDLSPQKHHQLIGSVHVSSGGLSSISEAEITIPARPFGAKSTSPTDGWGEHENAPRTAGPGPSVKRAVRLLAVDVFPNSMPPSATNERVESPSRAEPLIAARKDLGLTVWGYVEAVGLDRLKMVGRLSLRRADGEPLMHKDPGTGVRKPFESRAELAVKADQAQIFLHFVPYAALGLDAGEHPLILTYSASCEGLTAIAEELHVIRIAAKQEQQTRDRNDPPAQP